MRLLLAWPKGKYNKVQKKMYISYIDKTTRRAGPNRSGEWVVNL